MSVATVDGWPVNGVGLGTMRALNRVTAATVETLTAARLGASPEPDYPGNVADDGMPWRDVAVTVERAGRVYRVGTVTVYADARALWSEHHAADRLDVTRRALRRMVAAIRLDGSDASERGNVLGMLDTSEVAAPIVAAVTA